MVCRIFWNIFRLCFINNFILKTNFQNIISPKFKTSWNWLIMKKFLHTNQDGRSPRSLPKHLLKYSPTRKNFPTKCPPPSFHVLNESLAIDRTYGPNIVTRFLVIFWSNMQKCSENIGCDGCPLDSDIMLALGQPNSSQKNIASLKSTVIFEEYLNKKFTFK